VDPRWRKTWGEALLVAAVVCGATAAALFLRPYLAPVNLAMVYLLGVAGVAARSSRWASAAAAVASAAAFDFFCVPPYLTFAVADTEYLITFAAMLVVALVISAQTARILEQAREAAAREARAQTLYRLSDRLASETRVFEAARAAAAMAAEALSSPVVIFLPEDDSISFRRRTSDVLPVPVAEETIANWVYHHGRKAGKGVDDLLRATALYVPLRGARAVVGVMAVLPTGARPIDSAEQKVLIDLFANQTALAIERTLSHNAAEASRVEMQTEQMRSALLSAVSHDLRTPLASITGAASTLRQQGERLPAETRHELLESISEEAERLGRLVSNLLDMTRFESGGVELRRDLYPLEEIAGAALQRLDGQLQGRDVTVQLPDNLALVYVDDVLVGQVFTNLLENAAKYTPPGSPIEIAAREQGQAVQVEVRDHGPGFKSGEEERIFEKFYRSRTGGARGAGLGLAICRAVVEAHGGSIEAWNHPQGGAVFRFRLPRGEAVENRGGAIEPGGAAIEPGSEALKPGSEALKRESRG
jgi:two-component system sensor histidine kinase KdpD